MTNTSLDLSNVDDLSSLAGIVRVIQEIAAGTGAGWFIIGAAARDLLLHHGYGMAIRRRTADVDIAIAVQTWEDYLTFTKALIARGAKGDRKVHRFHFERTDAGPAAVRRHRFE